MRVHDRLHDRQADPAAAILPRACLIHFVELIPDLIDILLGNRIAGIEDGRRHDSVLCPDAHIDLPVIIQMIERITHIVRDDLFDLELISPHVDRLTDLERDSGSLLGNQETHPRDHTVDQGSQVEPLHHCLVISKLQLIKRQELFDHGIHFIRLVNDDIAVKLPALRIVCNIILESLGVPGDQRDRRFQLMGDIVEEFLADLIDLILQLDVFLKLNIGCLQFGNCLLQRVRHLVKILSELIDLVSRMPCISGVKIELRHPFGKPAQLDDRIGDPL